MCVAESRIGPRDEPESLLPGHRIPTRRDGITKSGFGCRIKPIPTGVTRMARQDLLTPELQILRQLFAIEARGRPGLSRRQCCRSIPDKKKTRSPAKGLPA